MPFRDSADDTAVQRNKPVSAPLDWLLSGITGVDQGGAGMLGMAGDLTRFAKSLPVKGAAALERHQLAPKGSAEVLAYALDHPFVGGLEGKVKDATKLAVIAALRKGGASPGKATAAANIATADPLSLPTTRDIESALGADASYHTPQTKGGDYARTIGQFVPSALFPGTAWQRAANVVIPAITSETAGQLTKGTKLEPWARFGGALLGGVGAGAITQPRPTTSLLADYSKGATSEQIFAAQALREDAARRGLSLTQAEALQQVTGNATGMGTLQRVLEGTRPGSEHIGPVMAQRPEQVRNAVTGFADKVAPATPNPSMLGVQAQQQAEGGLAQIRRAINARADPSYAALASQEVPENLYQQLIADPSYRAALESFRGQPELSASVAHLPQNNLSVVNEVVKHLDTMASQVRPGEMNPSGNARLSSLREAARGVADSLAGDVSASVGADDWNRARQTVAAGRAAELEPLQRGPLGAIAATPDVARQTRALFPSAPVEGAPSETAQALRTLMQQDSSAAPGLVRQHVMNTFNEGSQMLQGGANQWGGAKWAATVAGNPEQERALMAGIGAVGGDTADAQGLIAALRATGTRQPPGSMTAYNMEELRNLGREGTAGRIMSTGLNAPGTFRRLGDMVKNWQLERNANQLAKAILANPEDATAILMHARKVVPPGRGLTEIERLAVTANQGRLPAQ